MGRAFRIALSLAIATSLAACSGGGGAPVPLAVHTSSPSAPTGTGDTGTLTFKIVVPGRTGSGAPHRRIPAYVSASTAQVVLTVQGQSESVPETPQTFACTSVCAGSFAAPAGVDHVTIALQDAASKTLSTGVSTVLVFAGQTNTFAFTLDGVVASVDLTVVGTTVPVVPASTGYVLFNARDADGNIITYNGAYADTNDNPLVFDLASSSANFKLSTTTISGPGTLVAYTYDGGAHVGTFTLTPSAHAGVTTTATFTPATLTYVPGIEARIAPPEPITVLSVDQFPTTAFIPMITEPKGSILIVGNGAGATAFTYGAMTGTYQTSIGLASSPSLYFVGPGLQSSTSFLGEIVQGTNFQSYQELNGSSGTSAFTTNKCPNPFVPLATLSSLYLCDQTGSGTGGQLLTSNGAAMNPTSNLLAAGTTVKVIEIAGSQIPYVQSRYAGASSVWTTNVAITSTPAFEQQIAGAASVGADTTNLAALVLGNTNGTVTTTASATALATFTAPVTAVVRGGSAAAPVIAVLENRGFGYFDGMRVYETGQLPIGVPVDVVIGYQGAPVIVESDGTLDVMAI